jgi:uncharacterized protein UPF0182
MRGRGRRIAVTLFILALILAAGRWGAEFLSDRLWEASVGERVAQAGGRRALLSLLLELTVLLLAAVWFVTHFTIAARIALPDRLPPERDAAKLWPPQLPRWSLGVLALVMAGFLGSGAGAWLDELLLSLDGVRFGVPDPLLGADLGVFVRHFPLWLDLQHKATLLIGAALGGVVLLHLAGETVRITERRLWIWPRARGQLALLLGLLALSLGWACALEPYRLAAGLRGPLLSSEFVLRSLVSRIQLGLAATTALLSFLWWFRVRGSAVVALWLLFGLGLVVGRGLPLHGAAAAEDPAWRTSARALDSLAFQLGGLESGSDGVRAAAAALKPSLWDDTLLAQTAADSGVISEPRRGWLPGPRPQPVWFAVREPRGQAAGLLALSDDRVSPSGGLLAWHESDTLPTPEVTPYRGFLASDARPQANRVEQSTQGSGVVLDNWAKRIVLAWALQAPKAFSAARGTRIAWRLDPEVRLRTAAPFAHWTPPRARLMGAELVWLSDGLLSSSLFPSSARVEWGSGKASMLRSAFIGLVHARSGLVRIFRRDVADSLAAAWGRITAPLIEAPDAIPAGLRDREGYPEELLLVQCRVLEGAPWRLGLLERLSGGRGVLPPAAAGGSEHVVPFLHASEHRVSALLLARRTSSGDSLRVVHLDSLWTVEPSATLNHRWEIFPFQQAMRDSVLAAGAAFVAGQVRYALAAEGVVAYQPAWSVTPSGHAQLVLVNVGLGRANGADRMALGAGRNIVEAWTNFRGEPTPLATGSNAQAILEQARRLMLRADSALKRGDLTELGRTLAYLRDLLGPRHP